jgi:hypothetical protein
MRVPISTDAPSLPSPPPLPPTLLHSFWLLCVLSNNSLAAESRMCHRTLEKSTPVSDSEPVYYNQL